MRRMILAGCLAVGLAAPAQAETLLRLSASAGVPAVPDELDATLAAQVQAPGAAEAQSRVNAMMARALEAARAVPGLNVATGGYQVFQVQQPSPHWQAAQTLAVHGKDGAALLALVGRLQGQGLTVQGLAWRLSSATAEAAHRQATAKALAGLRARAEAAAKVLGLGFDSFREVRLDAAQPPLPMPRLMVGAAMAAAPVAEAGSVEVRATVEADAVLK